MSAVRRAAQFLTSVGRHVREDATDAAAERMSPLCQPSSGPATGVSKRQVVLYRRLCLSLPAEAVAALRRRQLRLVVRVAP